MRNFNFAIPVTTRKATIACLVVLLASCTNNVDEPVNDSASADLPNVSDAENSAIANPIQSTESMFDPEAMQTGNGASNNDANGQSDPMAEPQFNADGIASSSSDLFELLQTEFVYEQGVLTPISTWICSDGVSQTRFYYFYQSGILDETRAVAVERTLNINDTFTDIQFFWQASTEQLLSLVSAETDASGLLQDTGRQYDIDTVVFEIVENRTTFTANSVLRGRLICAYYDIN